MLNLYLIQQLLLLTYFLLQFSLVSPKICLGKEFTVIAKSPARKCMHSQNYQHGRENTRICTPSEKRV